MERAFFETSPGAAQAVQAIDAPAELAFDMPASRWTVRPNPYAWEVEAEMTWPEMKAQGVQRAYWFAYFMPAFENYFWAASLVPRPWSDLVKTMQSSPQGEAEFLPRCPKLAGALAMGQAFARGGEGAQAGPFAISVAPANRLAAISNEWPTQSVEHPPDVSNRETRQVAWGAVTWALELSQEVEQACQEIVAKELRKLPGNRVDDTLERVQHFLEGAEKVWHYVELVQRTLGG